MVHADTLHPFPVVAFAKKFAGIISVPVDEPLALLWQKTRHLTRAAVACHPVAAPKEAGRSQATSFQVGAACCITAAHVIEGSDKLTVGKSPKSYSSILKENFDGDVRKLPLVLSDYLRSKNFMDIHTDGRFRDRQYDYAAIQLTSQLGDGMLYPSVRPLKVGDNVATLGYPALGTKTHVYDYGNGYEPIRTSRYQLFWGYDPLVASLGKVTGVTDGIVQTSSSTAKRMCGGPVICLDDTESRFCGIHVGTSGSVGAVGNQVATEKNFFLSTMSPQFALFYVLVILPTFGGNVPAPVKEYLKLHKTIIEEYWKDALISPGTEKVLQSSIPWLPRRVPNVLLEDE